MSNLMQLKLKYRMLAFVSLFESELNLKQNYRMVWIHL